MKKILMTIAGILLLTNTAIAQDQQNNPPRSANLTVVYNCMSTEFVMSEINHLGLKKVYEIGPSRLGVYQEWQGDMERSNVWILILVAPNGMTCKLDRGYIGEPPISDGPPESTPEKSLDDFK